MSSSLPQSYEFAPRIETTSKVGSYLATFVVGVLGFIVGNLALDVINEQIHHNTSQAPSQPASSGPPILATESQPTRRLVPPPAPAAPPSVATQPESQAESASPAMLPPAPTGSLPLAIESEPRPLAELLQPQEPYGKQPIEVSRQAPVARMKSLLPALGPAGQIIEPNSTSGDASATGKGDSDQAAAIRLNPKLAEAYCGRGVSYGQKGSYDKAIADLTEAIRLDPKLVQAYCGRGIAYGHKGMHDRAITDFNQAIRLNPSLAVAYYGRGCANWYYGQKAKAEEDFARAKRLGYTSPRPSSTNFIQMSLSALAGVRPPP
jgi:hypothetical protein